MAEFCKKHSREMGFPFEGYPLFCESCEIYYSKPKSLWKRIKDWFSQLPNVRSAWYWRGDR